MGRNKIYKTIEEQTAARKIRQMNYYWRNNGNIKAKAIARYHKKKNTL